VQSPHIKIKSTTNEFLSPHTISYTQIYMTIWNKISVGFYCFIATFSLSTGHSFPSNYTRWGLRLSSFEKRCNCTAP